MSLAAQLCWRRSCAAVWQWVGLLSLALRVASSAEDTSACNLGPWLQDSVAPGEEGYHVLCPISATRLHIYRGGLATASPLVLDFDGKSLRKQLAEQLGIKKKISYEVAGKRGQREKIQWQKQPWALFTDDGRELRPGKEAEAIERGRPLLLFEGGIWRWPTVRVGHERWVLPNVVLRTVARQPALFEVLLKDTEPEMAKSPGSDRLSTALLSDVVDVARPQLVPSATEGKVIKKMRSSEQTFLSYDSSPKLQELHRLTAALLRAPTENLVEFQVLRYQKDQHYDSHRDYWDPREFPDVPRFRNAEGFWTMRHATLLWYLQAPDAGGETWFPRAHGGPIPSDNWMACDGRGEKISPSNATAVLFYNLRADGDIDEFSWHCGCPVKKGVKWAANSWLSNTPGRPRAWVMEARERKRRRHEAGEDL